MDDNGDMITLQELKDIAFRTIYTYEIYDDISWYSTNGEPEINLEYNDLFIRTKNAFATDIGICGCGAPFETWVKIHHYLKVVSLLSMKTEYAAWNTEIDKFYKIDYGLAQFMAYILDDKGYTDHGTSIIGAFITPKGEDLLTLLDTYMTKDIESDIFED